MPCVKFCMSANTRTLVLAPFHKFFCSTPGFTREGRGDATILIYPHHGDLSYVLFNTKYAGHVYKITVAVDNLGNIVWIYDLMPGTSADVMIWYQCGPSRTNGQFLDFEVDAHDGAY